MPGGTKKNKVTFYIGLWLFSRKYLVVVKNRNYLSQFLVRSSIGDVEL